jgi:hypothetical protein
MKTRIERIWSKIDELQAALHGNPHTHIEKARKVAQELEDLAMIMRHAELRRKLRRK